MDGGPGIMNNSIRTRLLIGIGIFVALSCVAASFVAFNWAYNEAIEFQDATLWQVGHLVADSNSNIELPPVNATEIDTRVVVEILGASHGTEVAGLPPLPASLIDGFQTVERAGASWRVLVRTRSDGSRVAIGQATKARDEIALGSALRAIVPLLVVIPLLLILVTFVIRYSFLPVARLAEELDRQEAEYPRRLPTNGMPAEILPFIESINRLLDRIDRLFEQRHRFIAHAAHELRTPIAALSLQIETLDHSMPGTPDPSRLEVLRAGMRRTARLLEQLLALARFEGHSHAQKVPPLTSLDDIARELIAFQTPGAAARNIDLGFAKLEPVSARIEPAAFQMVVRNILENAMRFTPDGGRIDVTVTRDGQHAVLRVEDSGPGVSPDELAAVLLPFERGRDAKNDGSGLGLSIVRTVAETHGGDVTLANGLSGALTGLCVTARLPAVHA
jgi:two-component system OmpR family sensor kinase